MKPLRLAITPGEPAGIGPDIVIEALSQPWPSAQWVVVASAAMLRERARLLGRQIELRRFEPAAEPASHQPGVITVQDVPLASAVVPGQLNVDNAPYVMQCLEQAVAMCIGENSPPSCSGMVTAPVHKGIINQAGIPFSGHTEFLAARAGCDKVVMMLASEKLRVALVTTHLPLRRVADAITAEELRSTLDILHRDLQQKFAITSPRILVCGLNPHAGEGGHLGNEEIDVIQPVLHECRALGMLLEGPLPADSLFTPAKLEQADAVLAMYHDQGLGPLKALSFGTAVNITLGLPYPRTSVDHGTALELAGSGRASATSLLNAMEYAISLCHAHG